MNVRARLLALWGLALLATLLVFMKGRGLSPSKAATMAFSYENPNSIRIKVAGVHGKSGIYYFPEGVKLEGVINMALSGVPANKAVMREPGRRMRDGESVSFYSGGGKYTEISVEMMPVAELILLGIPLDPNAMLAPDWEVLPGIGPKLAQRIVLDRQQNGAFSSLEDLERVTGIGPKTVDRIKNFF